MPGPVLGDSRHESGLEAQFKAAGGRDASVLRAVTERNHGRPYTQPGVLKDMSEVSEELGILGVGVRGV